MAHMDPERDMSRVRTVTLDDGFEVYIEARDPFGFWHIRWSKGQTPKALKSQFTTYDQARRALDVYLRDHAPETSVKNERRPDLFEGEVVIEENSTE